ncbi:MAG: ArgR family transcriptional regulator [Actinomycetota bacterium]|jgi:transcriptional regulator of arginine metabolism
MTKSQRQHRVAEIINEQVVSTAAHIVRILVSEGIAATQATVTRDLQEIGAVKVSAGGVRRLSLPQAPSLGPAPFDHLRRLLGEWGMEIENSGHLIVVRTPPGCAHVVASALDRSGLVGMLGTVAGDDTILVIARENYGGAVLANDLRILAGLDTTAAKRKK